MRSATTLLVLATVATLVGCAGEVERDDNLIDADALPELHLVEEVRIGSVDDPEVGFSKITGSSIKVDDDFVYVYERMAREIRIFDHQGRQVRTIGGQGEGPSEFRVVRAWGVLGDTVWVEDIGALQFKLFGRDGRLLLTVPQTYLSIPAPGGVIRVFPFKLRHGGLFESFYELRVPPNEGSVAVPRLLYDLSGSVVDTVRVDTVPFPTLHPPLLLVGGRPIPPQPRLFPDRPLSDTLLDGTIIRVRQAPAESDTRSVFTVTRTRGFDTLYHTRFAYSPRRSGGVIGDSLLARQARPYEQWAGAEIGQVKKAIWDALDPPEFMLPVRGTQAGADGSIWLVREDQTIGDRWIIVLPDGKPRGELRLPHDLDVSWVTAQEFWAVELDDFDVPWVVRYTVRE